MSREFYIDKKMLSYGDKIRESDQWQGASDKWIVISNQKVKSVEGKKKSGIPGTPYIILGRWKS
jgi:hypothetical protein